MSPAGVKQVGFTLIEVLVAFAILVRALPVLYAIFSNGLRSAALTQDYLGAVTRAESELAAIGVSKPLLAGETYTGNDDRYTWSITTEAYEPWGESHDSNLSVRAYRVVLDVSWWRGGKKRSVSLTTLKLAGRSVVPG